jgi:acyl-CoA synthetase (NDP forming)
MMKQFYYPDSVAIIGVSPRPGNLGRNIAANMKTFGFAGPVYYVSPRGGELRGQPIYTDVREIPGTPSLAVILTPAATVPGLMQACAEKGIKRVIVETGGFSELDQGRGGLELQLSNIAREHGMRFVGPNCIGLISTDNGLAVPFPIITKPTSQGGLSIVAQSGGIGLTYLNHFSESGVGVAKFASVGNKLNVNEEDFLAYLIEDPKTEYILLYLESIVAGRRMFDLISATDKPVVVHKSNIGSTSHKIAQSHTAALANNDAVVEAALEQAGAIRAHTVSDCFHIIKGLSMPRMKGRRVAVISRSGGHAVVAADSAHRMKMELPSYPDSYLKTIQEHTRASVIKLQNPLDLGDLFDFHFYVEILKGALALPEMDGVLIVHGYRGPEVEASREYIKKAGELCHEYKKPVGMVLLTDAEEVAVVKTISTLPVFDAPEQAMLALQASAKAGANAAVAKPPRPEGINLDACRQVLKAADANGALELPEALHLLGAAGVPVAPFVVAADAEEAAGAAEALGYPVVLKAVGGDVSHKTEQGGVVLNLADTGAVKAAAGDMQKRLSLNRMLVMKQLQTGTEVIVGAKQDPAFGALVLCGLGGVLTEVLQDVSLCLAPVDSGQAMVMLDSLKGKPLLEGFRGAPKVEKDALAEVVSRVSALAAALPELLELDLNPVMAGPDGVVAVDARARIKTQANA